MNEGTMLTFEALAIILGALVNVVALLTGIWKLSQISAHVKSTFDYFAREHEILIQDYCDRKGIELKDLATRLRLAPWWKQQ